jgi:hypothetical protein
MVGCCEPHHDSGVAGVAASVIGARFADRVYFGDKIITKIWKTGSSEAIV